MANIEEVEQTIQSAVGLAKAYGAEISSVWNIAWSVKDNRWHLGNDMAASICLCPMACVVLACQTEGLPVKSAAAYALGIEPEDVDFFIDGFDGIGSDIPGLSSHQFYKLGSKLRMEHHSIKNHATNSS